MARRLGNVFEPVHYTVDEKSKLKSLETLRKFQKTTIKQQQHKIRKLQYQLIEEQMKNNRTKQIIQEIYERYPSLKEEYFFVVNNDDSCT